MSIAHAEALCEAIRRQWPHARVAPGQVTGDGTRAAKVLCPPRPCPNCGTQVIALRRPGQREDWYQLGGHEVKPNGWSRVSYLRHNTARCRSALDGHPLVLPDVGAAEALLAKRSGD